MQRTQITDFTEGSIPKHLVMFSIPMLLGNLLQALYNTVDSIWVGRFLGPHALAAVSVGFPVIFALIALVNGVTMATTILVSQYFGARQQERLVKTVTNSLILLVALGLIISVIGVVFRRPLLELINTPPEIIDMASEYLAIYMAGLVGMFLYNVASAILRGLGDSRTPLRFLAYATFLNIVLDPLLIFGLGPIPPMGVAGVALATVIAQGMSAVISLRYLYLKSGLLHYEPGMFRLDWELTSLTFRVGLPAGIQQVLVSLSSVVVNSIVNSFGATVIAGFGAASRLDQFAFMPSMTMGMAVSALVGQNLGAGKSERVSETVRWSAILSSSITAIVSAIAILRPDILMVLFTKDEAVLAQGALYLRYVSLSYIPMALMFTIGGVMRGAGDTVATMLLTLVSLWLFRVPLAKYLSSIPELGVGGVWLGIAMGSVAGFLLNFGYYKTGRWKRRVLVQRTVDAESN
ncbi:MAG: MATE family efflux transporter [Firmicutes bacterium]|nr:MATE family efflux transporter [Bacillota bacterium]